MEYLKENYKEILLVLLVLSAVVQLAYYWLVFRRVAFFKVRHDGGPTHPVSIIICAKNEANRLRKYLPSVLEQAYPNYEVIVVNDCSWDETGEYLDEIAKQYPHLKIVTIKEQEKYRHSKKFALTLGIKAAKNDVLIMTDADCIPAGKNWVALIQKHFNRNTKIVLGYGAYNKETGFLNKLIRFDAFQTAMQYFSYALGGNAYMGVGRNLAYDKSLFFANKGFARHNHILSGDDDLFVNENATSTNTSVELDPESFTYSEPKRSFADWMKQKKRHLLSSAMYKSGHKIMLFGYGFSSFIFYGLIITLIALRYDWKLLLTLYASVLVLKFPVVFMTSSKLKEKDLSWLFPVLEPVHTVLQPVFYTANIFSKPKSWK